jgi:nucleoside-diphosphate-sugar epimerase
VTETLPPTRRPRPRILVTGPAGRVGPHLLPFLREHYALRLLDAAPRSFELVEDDEFIQADIQDLPAMERACAGSQAIVHLAAISEEADFHSRLLPVNLAGVFNVFEAARRTGVSRVVFTSTGQTVLAYPKGDWVTTEMPARPSSVYACTKLFGEALARHYADVHGMQMIVIRLCWFQPYTSPLLKAPDPIWREWCSPKDFAQLVLKSLQAPVSFGVFFGVSNNTGRFWDIRNAEQLLGYSPVDNAFQRV